jgi:hypothetical protein
MIDTQDERPVPAHGDVQARIRAAFQPLIGLPWEVFPDNSLDSEHWRIFVPGSDAKHFVVTGAGIE